MKKVMGMTALIIAFALMLVGCAKEDVRETVLQETESETTQATEATEEIATGDKSDHEGGLPGYWPLYPGATFVEIEDDPTGAYFLIVYIYESEDDVGDIFDWYIDSLENSAIFLDVEVEYESEEFCKVKGVLPFMVHGEVMEMADSVQIDMRNRDNTQLRFIVANIDKMPGLSGIVGW